MTDLLRKNIEDITAIPEDTLIRNIDYIGKIFVYTPTKDVYSVLISSSLISHVKDKVFLMDLIKTYSTMEEVTLALNNYSSGKTEAFAGLWEMNSTKSAYLMEQTEKDHVYPLYKAVVEMERVKTFLYFGINGPEVRYRFNNTQKQIEEMISKIKKQYGT
ncbi:MAG: hypothetical protein LUE93_15070 [Bacteroides sp.]|nr:hypothetical protein [Bacteroides sp.]